MKKTVLIPVSAFLLAVVVLASCAKENEQTLSGGLNLVCDSTNSKYTANILPILQANCYSCHGNGSTGGSGGISLDGYANLKPWAANGFLVGNVTHAPGFVGMPFGLPKLSDCDINKILSWVNHGALNN